MTALITGASGFLGGRLAQMLIERGEDVTILARPTSDLRHLSGLPLRVVQGDLTDPASLHQAVQGATRIFHCAACSTDWAPYDTYYQANVVGTKNLLAAAQNSTSCPRFVHVSTTDIYGYPLVPGDESNPSVDAGLPYNQTKIMGENAVWHAHHTTKLPITILRPATIYGPRGKDFTVEVAALLRQRLMATIDGGKCNGGFTYVDNVAAAMILASTSPAAIGEAYNLSDGTQASWNEYLTLFAAALGTPRPWINLSFQQAMTLADILEFPHKVLNLKARPLLTRHAVYLLARDQEFPITKIQTDLGFTPQVSLDEGIARSVAWIASRK